MKKILIANSDIGESEQLLAILGKHYITCSAGTPQDFKPGIDTCDLVLLDSNFTENQGIDFLMQIVAHANVPVLFVCTPEDPKCAVEAARSGAHNYIIRTGNYLDLMEHAIDDALQSFNQRKALDQTILTLRARVAALEKEIENYKRKPVPQQAPAQTPARSPSTKSRRSDLVGRIIDRLGNGEINLPPCPDTGIRLKRLLNEDASLAQVASLLREDIAIASKLIAVSNSPMYLVGAANRSLEQAISSLGLDTSAQYVKIIENRALYAKVDPDFQRHLKHLWEHAITVAHGASIIAALSDTEKAEELFTIGLLHDIGKVLLLRIMSEMKAAGEQDAVMDDAHLEDFLHEHHTGFGRAVLQRWGFPTGFTEVILHHENPLACASPSKAMQIVHVADQIALTMDKDNGDVNIEQLLTGEVAKNIGIQQLNGSEFVTKVRDLVKASAACG